LTRQNYFRLRFAMGGANALANLVGAVFVQSFAARLGPPLPEAYWSHPVIEALDIGFTPFAFLLIMGLTIAYETPIRRCLGALADRRPLAPQLLETARRRLLNEPLLTMAVDLGVWLLATAAWCLGWWAVGAPASVYRQTIFNCGSIGLITVTVVFFLQEHVLQKHLAPIFFPGGGLSHVPGTRRIRIRTRLAMMLLAINIIPLASILTLFLLTTGIVKDPRAALDHLRASLLIYCLIFLAAGLFLTGLVSRNLSTPFGEMIAILKHVLNGRFDRRVRVTTNDEIGYTGDVINEMTAGLREREQMRQALGLAMEVQQNLLPKADPQITGLDIAGASIYCEETGGDYFDYLPMRGIPGGMLPVAVGDVSDHGVSSALLMTTIRAFLRQRAADLGELVQVVGDVNRQLCRDVEDSGHFVTVFLAVIDRPGLTLRWVNAGHEPAAVFDPRTDAFAELGRTGLPLGVDPAGRYAQREIAIAPGQIILIGTDGIWESQNGQNEMFGKKRFQALVRTHCRRPAREILAAVVHEVERFRHPMPLHDDLTLVVVKVGG
jgi:sigma-B regulation protein RsbU (phosphoserine phosphatase)